LTDSDEDDGFEFNLYKGLNNDEEEEEDRIESKDARVKNEQKLKMEHYQRFIDNMNLNSI
jgi:hypothetical protein